mgnify:CR=1 FL=1
MDGDTLAGFDYELMEAFARDHGLKVAIMPEMSFEKRLEGLADGTYDLIANGILATSPLKDSLLLTVPIALTKEVLVQRKPASPDDSLFIRTQLSLAKRTLHVVKGSPSILRIRNLGDEIADTIYIQEIEQYGPEQLMAMVSGGDIDYAVCDENIAKANACLSIFFFQFSPQMHKCCFVHSKPVIPNGNKRKSIFLPDMYPDSPTFFFFRKSMNDGIFHQRLKCKCRNNDFICIHAAILSVCDSVSETHLLQIHIIFHNF